VANIEIYTGMMCGFCYRAKSLLTQKNVTFTEIDVSMAPSERATMRERAGGRTSVPQIFINGKHIGGCDELYSLDQAGKLDPLLAA